MRLQISKRRNMQHKRSANPPSPPDSALRTLRRALNLAVEWDVMDRPTKIRLVKGEKQRARVLTEDERAAYLKAYRQPWRGVAAFLLGTGMRPGVFPGVGPEQLLIYQ